MLPDDMPLLTNIVRDISFGNAAAWFGMPAGAV